MRILLPLLCAVAPLAAQFPAAAAPFVPPTSYGLLAIDCKRLRDADGGRFLASRIFQVALPHFVQRLKLDDVEQYLQFTEPCGSGEDAYLAQTMILSGDRVVLPAQPDRGLEIVDGRQFVTGIDPFHWGERPAPVACEAARGVVLLGPEAALTSRFAPKYTPGVPSGDLLSMTLGKDVVAYWFLEVRPDTLDRLPTLLRHWLGDDPKATHLSLRLRVGGADLDEYTFEAVARFRDRQQAANAAQALRNDFDAAIRSRRLQSMRWLLSKVELQASAGDLELRVPCGRYGGADAALTQLLVLSQMPAPVPVAPGLAK